jgi:CheY-like chemotaxis protein
MIETQPWRGKPPCDPTHGPLSFHGRTVLVIEDHDDTREVLVRLLTSLGGKVAAAPDGLAGLLLLPQCRPDVVLCDLTTPIMSGFEFARQMRRDRRWDRVLLIAVTGMRAKPPSVTPGRQGFDGHLVKPVTEVALASITRRLAGGSDALATA